VDAKPGAEPEPCSRGVARSGPLQGRPARAVLSRPGQRWPRRGLHPSAGRVGARAGVSPPLLAGKRGHVSAAAMCVFLA